MKRNIFYLFCCFFIVSCQEKKEPNLLFHDTIDCNAIAKQTINELVENISFLPLDTCEQGMIKAIDKIRIEGEEIYLADFHTSKIAVYHQSGKYLYNIDNKGQGPQEYTAIKSFAVDSKYIYIMDNWTGKLIVYNRMNGAFVKQMKMPFVAWDIETLGDGNLVFAFAPINGGRLSKKQPPYRLFVTDSTLQVKHSILEYAENEYDALGQSIYFSRDGDNVIFGSYLFNGFSIINPDSLPHLHHVRMNLKNSLTKQTDVHPSEVSEYQFLTKVPFKCGEYIHLSLNKNRRISNGIYDKQTKQLFYNSKTDGHNALIPVIGADKDSLIGYLEDYDTYKKMIDDGFNEGGEKVEQTLKGDGFVLVFYRFK